MFSSTISRALTTSAFIYALAAAPLASATYFHVNKGCITYYEATGYENALCESCGPIDVSNGALTIFAGYSGDGYSPYETPGLTSDLSWPSSYGDVYYGEDNCLYDSTGAKISEQCAGAFGSKDLHKNPYNSAFYCA